MQENHKIALTEAINWIEQNYNPIGIIASGSIIRENPNKESDFDIYVIHEQKFRQRVQKFFNKVPCEIFVNNIEHTKSSFLNEQNQNRPVTAHMIATGCLIKGQENDKVKQILDEAKDYQNKPKEAREIDLIIIKYGITNWLEDANDISEIDEETCNYILGKTIDKIIDYWFIKNQKPLPRIKERLNSIKTEDLYFYNSLSSIFKQNNTAEKLKSTNELIEKTIGVKGFFEWQTEQQ